MQGIGIQLLDFQVYLLILRNIKTLLLAGQWFGFYASEATNRRLFKVISQVEYLSLDMSGNYVAQNCIEIAKYCNDLKVLKIQNSLIPNDPVTFGTQNHFNVIYSYSFL